MSPQIRLIAHNIRSTFNVGSILRTADGLGVERVYLTGYTPYPIEENEKRLPHLAKKIDAEIAKTALGAEKTVAWTHHEDAMAVITDLQHDGYCIVALEQQTGSISLPTYRAPAKVTVLLGEEVAGVSAELLKMCDEIIEIPMLGQKESFNVSVAAAIALAHIRFR